MMTPFRSLPIRASSNVSSIGNDSLMDLGVNSVVDDGNGSSRFFAASSETGTAPTAAESVAGTEHTAPTYTGDDDDNDDPILYIRPRPPSAANHNHTRAQSMASTGSALTMDSALENEPREQPEEKKSAEDEEEDDDDQKKPSSSEAARAAVVLPGIATTTSTGTTTARSPPHTRSASVGGIDRTSVFQMSQASLPRTDKPPTIPPPNVHRRIVSDSKVTGCSRDDLRRRLQMKRDSLTLPEQAFLDQLLVTGNEVEVQLASRKLSDSDLFFDYTTPRAVKPHYCGGGTDNKDEDGSNSQFTFDHVSGGASGAASEQLASSQPTRPVEQAFLGRQLSLGSARRMQALEQRKKDGDTLWKAHDRGLAVTSNSSKKSLLMRRGSCSSTTSNASSIRPVNAALADDIFRNSNNNNNNSKGAMNNNSNNNSDYLFVPRGMTRPLPQQTNNKKKFLRRSQSLSGPIMLSSSLSRNGRKTHRSSASLQFPGIPPRNPMERRASTTTSSISAPSRGGPPRRRKSVTFHADVLDTINGMDLSPDTTTTTTSSDNNSNPKLFRRSVSDSLAMTLVMEESNTSPTSRSSSEASAPAAAADGKVPPPQRQDSTSSIPSLHHGHPIRQDSVSSIPSLHHGHPIRQDSVSSIPSLHHAHPLRQDSVSSIPSLHHGHPIRQDSISSIPSLHHAHPLRQESMGSIPSIHHGHPIRQDSMGSIPSIHYSHSIRADSIASATASVALSSVGSITHDIPLRRNTDHNSIPSIHHAHPIRSNSMSSIPSLHHGHAVLSSSNEQQQSSSSTNTNKNSGNGGDDPKTELLPQYAAYGDIASAWLQQTAVTHVPEMDDSLLSIPKTISTTHEDVKNMVKADLRPSPDLLRPPSRTSTATTTSSSHSMPKPGVVMRMASINTYEGEGIEVTELDDTPLTNNRELYHFDPNYHHHVRNASFISLGDISVRTATSFDDSLYMNYRHDEIFRNVIQKSLSDDEAGKMFLGPTGNMMLKDATDRSYGEFDDYDESSWDMNSDSGRFDSWNVIKDEYANGYGGGGTLDFLILGTSAEDESAQPHVLSPPLMESLSAFLPFSKSGENFFLKYSMVRDGASLHTFLKRARAIEYSVLAIETVDGEVFGCFTAQAWRKNWNYFGTGESFLWRMRRSRLEKTHGILEQAQLESEIDVYPYTGENRFIQLCTADRIAVGGGSPAEKKTDDMSPTSALSATSSEDVLLMSSQSGEPEDYQWGFGLSIEGDFLTGTSSNCVTFASPPLSHAHKDGSMFEIINVELWTLTPCRTVADAEKLELGKLFLDKE